MHPINWQQFGLKKDPYDAQPLIEGGDVPIQNAFVGRGNEKDILDGLFESSDNVCLTVLGNVGVGKTSLANFHKYAWKHHKTKPLFSFRREMEASEVLLDKKNFLLEIIASVIREIQLIDPALLKNELLFKLQRLIDVTQTINISGGVSILGFGADIAKDVRASNPIHLSMTMLEQYFLSLIAFIKETKINGKQYKGLVIHINNFETVLKEKKSRVIKFFHEMRDMLQTKDVYYLFLGPKNLFRDVIVPEPRVKSIFIQTPLVIEPLSRKEIIDAFDERMRFLQSDGVTQYIKPVENEVVMRLYDLYDGDIRSIMSAIRDILGQCSDSLTQSLPIDQAMLLLARERWIRIDDMKITGEQKEVLKMILDHEVITQKDIAKALKKAQTNISGYYFKPLKENDVIEERKKEGRLVYWGLTKNYQPLRWLRESQQEIQKKLDSSIEQLSLF